MTQSRIKQAYQRIMPLALRDQFAKVRTLVKYRVPNAFGNFWLNTTWQVHPKARQSRTYLRRLHNQYKGKRCFIIGNGPSLRQMDLSPLQDEITFGMNRIYLLFPEMQFETTYYVSINDLVVGQFADDIAALNMPRFISWRSHRHLRHAEDITYMRPIRGQAAFSDDVVNAFYEGSTVTFAALQLAYYMGFSTVYLIGVDHNFQTKGEANKTVTSQSDDPNHFHPEYFGKGYKWQLPDLDGSEVAYYHAKVAYEKDGRQVYDATVNGKLQVYPKVSYDDLF
jgi:hypothetical protein